MMSQLESRRDSKCVHINLHEREMVPIYGPAVSKSKMGLQQCPSDGDFDQLITPVENHSNPSCQWKNKINETLCPQKFFCPKAQVERGARRQIDMMQSGGEISIISYPGEIVID